MSTNSYICETLDDLLYTRHLKDSENNDNGQVSIPEQRTIQCVSTSLNYRRPSTANINAQPSVAPETARPVFIQPHEGDMFYDQLKQDSRSSPHKGGDAREPLQSRSSDAITTQPSTQLNVSATQPKLAEYVRSARRVS
jgi:hypothetical protein